MVNKILFVDFCETIVDKQTADDFCYKYLASKGKKVAYLKIIKYLLGKFRLLGRQGGKRYVLNHLRGSNINDIEKYAKKYVKDLENNINYDVMRFIRQHKSAGYRIIIVSGGYEVYLKAFAKKYDIDDVIGTRFEIKDELLTGQFLGLDCMKGEKIARIIDSGIDLDTIRLATFISDHVSDLPLLKLTGQSYFFKKGSELPSWAIENNVKDYRDALVTS